MFYATARADSVVTYSVCRRTHPVDGRDMLLGGSARVVYKSYSRRPRLCAGVMVMVEKGVLQSAESSDLAASRASLLRMPTRALQAVSFNRAPSARFI